MPKREPKPLKRKKNRGSMTPEERENMCTSLAYDLVEQRLRDGTATAAETVHFLKLGSSREKLERQLMEQKRELEAAKTEAYASSKNSEELLREAIKAFTSYRGAGSDEDEEFY
jgi:hypothetical protein